MNYKFPFILIFAITMMCFATSCVNQDTETEDVKIAQAYGSFLYMGDIIDLIPDNLSIEDSSDFVNNIINDWITRQLKLYKAELNLNLDQKDVEKELEEYRSSLLIYKYEQQYINQKLDTNFSDVEIQEYYDSFNKEFVLKKNIVTATLVVVPIDVESYTEFRTWLLSGKSNYENKIAEFCQKYATIYSNYNDEWVYLDEVLKNNPIHIENQKLDLKYKRYFEKKEGGFNYLIYIHEYKLKNNIAPINIVERDIINILLNKRKLNLIRELEENTFSDATNLKNIKIFKN